MTYENAEGYPAYEPNRGYGFFGYPTALLDLAVSRDDPVGMKFYLDRYFTLDAMTFGSSLICYVANKGAVKCVCALAEMGATDPSFTRDELVAKARRELERPTVRPKA